MKELAKQAVFVKREQEARHVIVKSVLDELLEMTFDKAESKKKETSLEHLTSQISCNEMNAHFGYK